MSTFAQSATRNASKYSYETSLAMALAASVVDTAKIGISESKVAKSGELERINGEINFLLLDDEIGSRRVLEEMALGSPIFYRQIPWSVDPSDDELKLFHELCSQMDRKVDDEKLAFQARLNDIMVDICGSSSITFCGPRFY